MAQKEGLVAKFLSTLRDIPEDMAWKGIQWHKKACKFQKNQWHKNFKRAFFASLGGRTWHAFREEFYYGNQKKVMLVQIETFNNLHILQHETA